jgi:spore coat polysaccharide biosynthesis protein SpsF (cytidylyltransferase family)
MNVLKGIEQLTIGAIVPVRFSATRLPGKPLRDVGGQTALARVTSLAARCRYVRDVVVATTVDATDDVVAEAARSLGHRVYRGPVNDVLRRLAEAARWAGYDVVVEVDGDDLLCFPELMDRGVEILVDEQADWVSFRGAPIGATPNVLTTAALERAVREKPYQDTATGFFRFLDESGRFEVRKVDVTDLAWMHETARMTLDYDEDLAFFAAVWTELDRLPTPWQARQLIGLLRARPDLVALNQGKDEAYRAHFEAGSKSEASG